MHVPGWLITALSPLGGALMAVLSIVLTVRRDQHTNETTERQVAVAERAAATQELAALNDALRAEIARLESERGRLADTRVAPVAPVSVAPPPRAPRGKRGGKRKASTRGKRRAR